MSPIGVGGSSKCSEKTPEKGGTYDEGHSQTWYFTQVLIAFYEVCC